MGGGGYRGEGGEGVRGGGEEDGGDEWSGLGGVSKTSFCGQRGSTYGQFRRDISARESTIVVVLGQGSEGG